MARFCKRFYCDQRGDRYCCADCRMYRDCAYPCQNHPVRCGLVDPDGTPAKRRGGSGKLPRKKYYSKD